MSGGGTQNSLRKTLGSLKDTTTVSLAKINSSYKELDIAIVKATNHVEHPAKEKYIRGKHQTVVLRRCNLPYYSNKLHSEWDLIELFDYHFQPFFLPSRLPDLELMLHTAFMLLREVSIPEKRNEFDSVAPSHEREVDPTFHEELINYGRSRNRMLNMAHFKDDSSPNAWDYSAWVRSYALFLEERLECFRVLKYDVETDRPVGTAAPSVSVGIRTWDLQFVTPILGHPLGDAYRTKDLDTPELLEQLPALQQLLYRINGCQPQGASAHNFVIQLALSMVATESIKIYNAISDGTVNLVDKFFEMQRNDALRSLDIYRRAGQQAEALSEFYEICKNIDAGRGQKFIKIEQPPASFLQAMEEYVRDAPRASTVRKDSEPKVILAIEYKKDPEVKDAGCRSPPPPEPEKEPEPMPEPVKTEAPPAEPADLLSMDDPSPAVAELDEKNSLALAIIPVGSTNPPTSTGSNLTNGTSGWELALVEAPSSNESATTASKLGGGLDKLTLDSLYDDAMRQTNQNVSYNPWEPAPSVAPMMQNVGYDPFYVSNMVAAPTNVQMAAMANQQQAYMLQQQQQQHPHLMMMTPQQQLTANPFANPYGAAANSYGPGMPVQTAYNPYTGLI
ncbi:hypothetical protein RDI58_017267 [Solanum bulbocastanum]|uniref:ENTH domain-containing protein n=1 Tax=Solanum bulbocastanum TaxID=147425 RepID=A0AAN8T8I1_SOLBU